MAHNGAHIAQGGVNAPHKVCSRRPKLSQATTGPQGCPEAVTAAPGGSSRSEYLTGVGGKTVRYRGGRRIARKFNGLYDAAKGLGCRPLKHCLTVVVGT